MVKRFWDYLKEHDLDDTVVVMTMIGFGFTVLISMLWIIMHFLTRFFPNGC